MKIGDLPGRAALPASRYPHMLTEDAAVWTAYLKSDMPTPDEVWYDVHVGTPVTLQPGSPEWMHRVALGVTRKRIDVVARYANELWIIEIKPFGSVTGIGQVLTYMDLFEKEHPQHPSLYGVLLCFSTDQDLFRTAAKHNIRIIALRGVTL